jgi:hypothetical protein
MTNTDNPIDFPKEEIEPTLLDPGCAERGCMGYSPQFGDTECEEYFPATYVYELQREVARLKQQVAFLEDYRAIWAPVIRQHQGLE